MTIFCAVDSNLAFSGICRSVCDICMSRAAAPLFHTP